MQLSRRTLLLVGQVLQELLCWLVDDNLQVGVVDMSGLAVHVVQGPSAASELVLSNPQ